MPAIPTREFGFEEEELDGALVGLAAAVRRVLFEPLDGDDVSKPLPVLGLGEVPPAPRRRVRPSDMVRRR